MREEALIAFLKEKFASGPSWLQTGIGDDAAVFNSLYRPLEAQPCVSPSSQQSIITSDMLLDGVHFDLQLTKAYQLGRKTLAVNLSDCAAMAAQPRVAVVSLALPRGLSPTFLADFYDGLQDLAQKFGVVLCGGDTNSWAGPLAVSLTLVGEASSRGALLRSGAQVGDAIMVTGDLGGSSHGKHLDFIPRVHEAIFLHEHYPLHALMDLSDGLASDLPRLCKASGVGAELLASAIPLAAPIRGLPTALELALCEGEDFELLLTLPKKAAQELQRRQPLVACRLQVIGQIIAEPGLFWRKSATQREAISWSGYEHRW